MEVEQNDMDGRPKMGNLVQDQDNNLIYDENGNSIGIKGNSGPADSFDEAQLKEGFGPASKYTLQFKSELRANGKYYRLGTDEELKEPVYTKEVGNRLNDLTNKEIEYLVSQHKLLLDISMVFNIMARQTLI